MKESLVLISGPVYAQLLHEHSMSPNNQEGFFIGETTFNLVNQINDHAVENERELSITKICSFVPCNISQFCNKLLEVDAAVILKKLHGDQNLNSVVGFYSFRRNLPLTLSYREKCVLSNLMCCNDTSSLAMGVFSTSYNENFSVHSMEYVFHVVRRKGFQISYEPASFRIVNLGEDATQGYKNMQNSGVSVSEGAYAQILKKFECLRAGLADSRMQLIDGLHAELQRNLNETAKEILNTAQTVEETR